MEGKKVYFFSPLASFSSASEPSGAQAGVRYPAYSMELGVAGSGSWTIRLDICMTGCWSGFSCVAIREYWLADGEVALASDLRWRSEGAGSILAPEA